MLDDLHALVEFAHAGSTAGLEFGMLRTSLSLVLSVDCVGGRTSRGVDRATLVRNHMGVMAKHKHRDLTALGRNADLFQDLIVHG